MRASRVEATPALTKVDSREDDLGVASLDDASASGDTPDAASTPCQRALERQIEAPVVGQTRAATTGGTFVMFVVNLEARRERDRVRTRRWHESKRRETTVIARPRTQFQQQVVVPRAIGQVMTQDDAGTGRWWRRRSMKPDSICSHTEWLEGARTRAGIRVANGEGIRTGFD